MILDAQNTDHEDDLSAQDIGTLGDGQLLSEEEARRQEDEMLARINALGESLAKTRAEAIAARMNSGVEDDWYEDEEFYQGIDDANRGEHKSAWRQKPGGQTPKKEVTATRSTVFPNITGPYVDAASARIADMLLPTDDRAWSLAPTPIPELLTISEGKIPQQMVREAAQQYPGNPKLAQERLKQAVQEAARVMAEAKEKADKAQKRIEDWHIESQWHSQVRLVIEDAARIGTGILKGPIPLKKRRVAFKDGQITVLDEVKPGSKWISAWDFYPDPACGENIHNGAYTWEKDGLTRKQLRDLKGQEGYIDRQIDLCLEEGPCHITKDFKEKPDPVTDDAAKNKFEIWYYHGTAEREDLEAAGCDCEGIEDPHIPAIVFMVNNRVIKAVLNPLDTGDFPYDVMVWRRRSNHWTGIGVARQIRVAQRIVTAATRNLMDNAGLAAGPMIVFRRGVVTPANNQVGIAPRKIWYIGEDHDEMADATKAIGVVKVDMLVNELMQIIQLGLKLAEDVTGLPMLLQGQMGKAPDTVGGMQMLNNNASSVLRRLAKMFDDRVTEPHVRRYYNWLLQHGEDDEKGDYCIDARGSSALVERDLQNQAVLQMGSIILDPRFGVDPKKWFAEYCKSQRLDVKKFEFDDDKWQQIVENMQKGPQDPRMAVAEMRMQSEERERQHRERLLAIEKQFEEKENDLDRQMDLLLKSMDSELEARRQSGAERISMADIKAMLASRVLDIRSKNSLFNQERALKLKVGSGV